MTYYNVEFYKDEKKVHRVKIDTMTTALSFVKFMVEIGYTVTINIVIGGHT